MFWALMPLICLLIAAAPSYSSMVRRGSDSTPPAPTPTIHIRSVLPAAGGSEKSLIRLSADGKLVATGNGHGPVRVWQISTGKLIAALDGTEGQSPRAFSPTNDRLLASANLTSVSLYDLNSMRLRSRIALDKLFGGLNLFGSFSPDGKEFLIFSENKVSLWRVDDGGLIASQRCEGAAFRSQFSNDSQKVLTYCGGEKAVRLWDAGSGQAGLTFSSPTAVAVSVFSPDNQTLATATLSGQVLLWDVATGRIKKAWQGHGDLIFDAEFSPDGKTLATVSRDGTARLWDIEKMKPGGILRVGSESNHVVFSSDSKLLVVVGDGNKRDIRVWNIATAQPIWNFTGPQKKVLNVEFSPVGHLLVSSSEGSVNVWDLANGAHVAELSQADFPANFSKDGKTLVTGGPKGSVMLWDVNAQ